ncbi:MAG: di-heme oxidoredictase family protein [Pseudomonadota bacterium]
MSPTRHAKFGQLGMAGTVSTFALVLMLAAPSRADPWDERITDRSSDGLKLSGALSPSELAALTNLGEHLFVGKFTKLDGAGRPMATQAIIPTKRRRPARSSIARLPGPDASACSSCHNEPVIGGAGDTTANVFVSEGFTNANFDTTDPQFSNERNTNHLMGAGLVELLAREMTVDLTSLRSKALKNARETNEPVKVDLITKGIGFGHITAHADGTVDLDGIEGVDSDLQIRPFSQKGVFTSLRQFTVNAMNHHHGMQANERFGPRWTGEADFDEDGVTDELLDEEIAALVAWQATLPAPTQAKPENVQWLSMSAEGQATYVDIGCATCHVPALPLDSTIFSDPGPLDMAGTLRADEAEALSYDLAMFDWVKRLPRNKDGALMIPLFSDLKRHQISDQRTAHFGNELLAQRFVERDQFQTTELWGLASTAPYGHRGDLTTLDEAIRAHGGKAAHASQAYASLSEAQRDSLIAFLKTLVIEK